MHITVNSTMFVDAFHSMGREDQFSLPALYALFNYLEDLEQDSGEEMELDVIAICCDYTEYKTALEAAREYGYESELNAEDFEDREEYECELENDACDFLKENTTVIRFDGGFIIEDF